MRMGGCICVLLWLMLRRGVCVWVCRSLLDGSLGILGIYDDDEL